MAKTIALVACVSKKLPHPAPARDLYCSEWFTKASAYGARSADCWYILSAKYGLVTPESVIEPYNETLKAMSISNRKAWAVRVLADLRNILRPGDEVIFLAGDVYRKFLLDEVKQMGCQVSIPMEGLGIGKQLAWMKHRMED